MIQQAWVMMGFSYLLTIVVSLLVAVVIHVMVIMIRRFSSAAKPLPESAVKDPELPPPDNPDELLALAIAVAARRNSNS